MLSKRARNATGTRPAFAESMPRLHLVTFYSEGRPFDDGLNLTAQALILERVFLPHVDSFRRYSPRSIEGLTADGVSHRLATRRLAGRFPNNPGMNKLGGMTVKPWVLLHRLSEIEDGDLLVWKDANIAKHPNLLADPEYLRATVKWSLKTVDQDIFMPYENPKVKLKHHCKTFTIRDMARAVPAERLYDYPLHHANFVMLRKSAAAYNVLHEWLKACLHDEWIGPAHNPHPHPAFRWHTPEQCIFSVLAATSTRPYKRRLWFCWRHRRQNAHFLNEPDDRPCKRPTRLASANWTAHVRGLNARGGGG